MDRKWWNEYGETIKQGPELWTSNREAAKLWGLQHIHAEGGGGVTSRHNAIRSGGNSGFQALGLALHFGADRIILLGFDMGNSGGRTHWHGDHKNLGNPLPDRFEKWRQYFGEIPVQLRARVVNASRSSKLNCFRRVALHDCLAESEG